MDSEWHFVPEIIETVRSHKSQVSTSGCSIAGAPKMHQKLTTPLSKHANYDSSNEITVSRDTIELQTRTLERRQPDNARDLLNDSVQIDVEGGVIGPQRL